MFTSQRKPRDSNPQAALVPPPVFETGSSSSRMTSVIWDATKFRGLESNQRLPGSEPGVTTSSNCPGLHQTQARGGGFEPPSPDSKSGSLPLADPRS